MGKCKRIGCIPVESAMALSFREFLRNRTTRRAGMCILGLLVVFLGHSPADPNPWRSIGPWGVNTVSSFAMAPSEPSVLYSAFEGGPVHRTQNGGETWQEVGSPGAGVVISLAVSPHDSKKVCAVGVGPGAGAFLTENAGQTWARFTSPNLPTSVSALAFDLGDPSTMYAGGLNSVSRSTDSGQTWTQTSVGLEPSDSPIQFATHASVPNTVYMIARWSLHRSTDGGSTWATVLPKVTPNDSIGSVFTWSPSDPQICYVALNGHGLLSSTDGGYTFASLPIESNVTIYGMAVHPSSPSTLHKLSSYYDPQIYGSYLEIRSSTNAGSSWQTTHAITQFSDYSFLYGRGIFIDPTNPSRIYYAKADYGSSDAPNGIARSDSGPAGPWAPKVTGIAGLVVEGATSTSTGEVIARLGGRAGIVSSPPPYTEWREETGPSNSYAMSGSMTSHATNPGIVLGFNEVQVLDYSTWYVFYRRLVEGTWYSIFSGTNDLAWIVLANRYSPGEKIYFWVEEGWGPPKTYRNNGVFWQFDEFATPIEPTSAVIHPDSDDYLIASRVGADPIVESTDGGLSWSSISAGLPAGNVIKVLLDPQNPERLAAVYANRRPWKSNDGGVSWTEYSRPQGGSFTVVSADWVPETGNVLMATQGKGIVSTNGPDLNEGIPTRSPTDLSYNPHTKEILITRSAGGVFLRRLETPGPGRREELAPEPESGATLAGGHASGVPGLEFLGSTLQGPVEIAFTSEETASPSRVSIYDLAGRLVSEHHAGPEGAGTRRWIWDGNSQLGQPVAPGVYFVRLESGQSMLTRKIVRVR